MHEKCTKNIIKPPTTKIHGRNMLLQVAEAKSLGGDGEQSKRKIVRIAKWGKVRLSVRFLVCVLLPSTSLGS